MKNFKNVEGIENFNSRDTSPREVSLDDDNKETNQEESKDKEPRIVRITRRILSEFDIIDYRLQMHDDGLHVFITVPDGHIQERQQQYESLQGYLDPTTFEKTKLIPLSNKINISTKFTCDFNIHMDSDQDYELTIRKNR